MKAFKFFILFFVASTLSSFGQTDGVLPEVGKAEGTFTEWQKVTVSFEGGEEATFEYRIAFAGKKALACNYDLEIKNTSALPLKFKVETHYYDKLVKNHFGEKYEGKIKVGKTSSSRLITQGCKKEKGVEKSDLEHCLACEFSYKIRVFKD